MIVIRIKRIKIGQTGFGLQWLGYGTFMPEKCEKYGLTRLAPSLLLPIRAISVIRG